MRACFAWVLPGLLAAAAACDIGKTSPSGASAQGGASSSSGTAATSASSASVSSTSGGTGGASSSPPWACLAPYTTPATRDPGVWPFAPDSPWNVPLGAGAQFDAATGACTVDLLNPADGMGINAHQWSHPVYLAAATDPTVNLYDNQKLVDSLVHCPADAQPALPPPPNTDAHLHIVDPAHRFLDEMWEASKVSDGWGSRAWVKTDLQGPGVGQGGVRAYGGSAIGGLIRVGELPGAIRHALAFAIEQSQQTNAWVWPATTNDHAAASNYQGHLPMGQLAGIPPSVDLCSLGLSPAGLVLARALQDYGAYLVDTGGALAFYAEPPIEDDASLGEAAPLDDARSDLGKIVAQLRCVTNNASGNAGGGGAPRAPPAPSLP